MRENELCGIICTIEFGVQVEIEIDRRSASQSRRAARTDGQAHSERFEQLRAAPQGEASPDLLMLHNGVRTLAALLAQTKPNGLTLEQRLELTKVRLTALYEEARESERAVIEFASIGLKGLLIANGGALVAMLTFLGNYSGQPPEAGALLHAFAFFVAGLMLALLAVVLSYFAQSVVSGSTTTGAEKIYFSELRDHQNVAAAKEKEEAGHIAQAQIFRWCAILTALGSAIAFAYGAWRGISALAPMAAPILPTP